MSIKTLLISMWGRGYKISPHFSLGEMACKDGSDKVLISTELMDNLEQLRTYGGFTITINSGYRTPAYNRRVKGATKSQHVKGTAADIVVKKDGAVVNAKKICCLCQTLGFKGIGYISSRAVHVDMRSSGSYRGDERKGYGNNVSDFYKYFGVSKAEIEKMKVEAPKAEPKEEEEEMTQKQFNEMMEVYMNERAEANPAEWSAEMRQWAEEQGIIKGTGDKMEYSSFVTREQLVTMLYRALVDR